MNIYKLDTPSLLLDNRKLINNIMIMETFCKQHQLNWRPHVKTHKSIEIAKMQLAKGAKGITVAKLSEAEVMVEGGIDDILIAFPISSHMKVKKLIALSRKAKLIVAVDSIDQVNMLEMYLQKEEEKLEVWIKVNCGLNRCGVEPIGEVLDLAKRIVQTNKLFLGGIFTHAGHSYGAKSHGELAQIANQEAKSVLASAYVCELAGIPIQVRSVGSTPTYQLSGAYKGITEVRPGNAIFFDMVQVGLGVATTKQCAITVLATVVSVKPGRIILDTGSKTLCLDQGAHGNKSVKGYGTIVGYHQLVIERLSEEHGIVIFEHTPPLKLGDVVEIIPNHACTVVNMFEQYNVHENGTWKCSWNIDARGSIQ